MSIMKSTITTYNYSQDTRELTVPFDYLKREFVVVYLAGPSKPQKALKLGVDYKFTTKTTITITRVYQASEGYDKIVVRRVTDASKRIINFQDGSILNATELNTSQIQTLHVAEEARDLSSYTLFVDNDGNLDARGRKIINLGNPSEDSKDAVNVSFIEGTKDTILGARDETLKAKEDACLCAENAKQSEVNSKKSEQAAESSKNSSKQSEQNASTSATQASSNAQKATQMASQAQTSATEASSSQAKAKVSETNAARDAKRAEDAADKAVGGGIPMVNIRQSSGSGGTDLVPSLNAVINMRNYANVKDFGAKGDGVADDSEAFKKAINSGKAVFVPAGTYKVNIECETPMLGCGMTTKLKPFDISRPMITLRNHTTWAYIEFRNINFYGDNKTGIGFAFKDFRAGRYSFYNCAWFDFDIAFKREFGNIGVSFYSCDFERNKVAIESLTNKPENQQDRERMHNGNLYVRDSQFSFNEKHSLYFDVDPYNVVIDGCIFEYDKGISIFIGNKHKLSRPIDNRSDLFPSSISNCYFEGNGGDGSIEVDGEWFTKGSCCFISVRNLTIYNSNVINSVFKDSCINLDECYIAQGNSKFGECMLNITNASAYAPFNMKINSLKGITVELLRYCKPFMMGNNGSKFSFEDITGGIVIADNDPYEINKTNKATTTLTTSYGSAFATLNITKETPIKLLPVNGIPTTAPYVVIQVVGRTNNSEVQFENNGHLKNLPNSNDEVVNYTLLYKNQGTSVYPQLTFKSETPTTLHVKRVSAIVFYKYEEVIKFLNKNGTLEGNSLNIVHSVENDSIDYSKLLTPSYLETIFKVNIKDVNTITTKFGVVTNKPSEINSRWFKGTLKKDLYGGIKWEFETPNRVIYLSTEYGLKYIDTTTSPKTFRDFDKALEIYSVTTRL